MRSNVNGPCRRSPGPPYTGSWGDGRRTLRSSPCRLSSCPSCPACPHAKVRTTDPLSTARSRLPPAWTWREQTGPSHRSQTRDQRPRPRPRCSCSRVPNTRPPSGRVRASSRGQSRAALRRLSCGSPESRCVPSCRSSSFSSLFHVVLSFVVAVVDALGPPLRYPEHRPLHPWANSSGPWSLRFLPEKLPHGSHLVSPGPLASLPPIHKVY